MAVHPFILEPFTAYRISRLPADQRRAELTSLGVRHLRRARRMAWDGRDQVRGHAVAVRKYNQVMRRIEAVGAELNARWAA